MAVVVEIQSGEADWAVRRPRGRPLARSAESSPPRRGGGATSGCTANVDRRSAGVPGPPRTPATNSADPVSAVLAGCTTDLQRWQPVAAGNVAAAKSGAGPMTVVFLNDSGNSVCGWLSLPRLW